MCRGQVLGMVNVEDYPTLKVDELEVNYTNSCYEQQRMKYNGESNSTTQRDRETERHLMRSVGVSLDHSVHLLIHLKLCPSQLLSAVIPHSMQLRERPIEGRSIHISCRFQKRLSHTYV